MAKYKLLLPKMGESVAEATIIKWVKKPGDYIETDETVIEIATDKVDSDVPSPVSGKLLEQLCKEDDVVEVGAVVAIIETDEPDEIKDQQVSAAPVRDEYTTVTEQSAGESETSLAIQEEKPESPPEHHPAAEPESISDYSGAPEVEAPGETPPKIFAAQRNDFAEQVPYVPKPVQAGSEIAETENKVSSRFYSPLVKNIAAQEGIGNDELDKIPGTGAEGRLTKDDLLSHIQNRFQSKPIVQDSIEQTASESITEPVIVTETQEPQRENNSQQAEPKIEPVQPEPVIETQEPQPVFGAVGQESPKPAEPETKAAGGGSVSGGDEIIEMDRMRRLIAEHMVMSKHTSPHVTSFVEADVTNLVLWREKIKGSFEKREGEKITFTPIFIEAVVKAIRDFPMINISVNGTQITKKKDINISMATALPSGNLIVPVIKRADGLSLLGLTKAVNDLANRARINKLKPDDVQGGTFTITNVGSFGNVMGTPIINQPQVAILAVGAIKKKPAVIETPHGDAIGIRHMMFLSLSYDHRVVDGALGGSFIKRVADYLEKWDTNRTI